MVDAARRTGRVAQVGLHRRSSKLYHHVRDLVRSGRIGKVTVARAYRISNMHPAGIGREQACGRPAIQAALELARRHKLKPRCIDLRNSGDTAGCETDFEPIATSARLALAALEPGLALLAMTWQGGAPEARARGVDRPERLPQSEWPARLPMPRLGRHRPGRGDAARLRRAGRLADDRPERGLPGSRGRRRAPGRGSSPPAADSCRTASPPLPADSDASPRTDSWDRE